MKRKVSLIVVIPAGPNCKENYLIDTIESVYFYLKKPLQIIVIDDTTSKKLEILKEIFPEIIILRNNWPSGFETLYLTLSSGFIYAFRNFDFDVILKLDVDALIIGKSAEQEAINFFQSNQNVGLIGSHKIDCNGRPRDFSWAAQEIIKETLYKNLFKSTRRFIMIKRILARALKNNYQMGEHCLGGAYFISQVCMKKLYESNFLLRKDIVGTKLQEDHIFPLLTKASGMDLGDFATGDKPFGLKCKGLPCAPAELISRKKKVIHSVRFWQDMREDQIREYFRGFRQNVVENKKWQKVSNS